MQAPLELLRDSAFFDVFEDEDLVALASEAERMSFRKGDRIVEEGEPSERLYILVSGTVELSLFAPHSPDEMDPRLDASHESIKIHRINEPGALIGWSAMVEPYRCRATATALEITRVVAFDRELVEAQCQQRPRFGIVFVRRILWALGDRLGSSRAQLASRKHSPEADQVRLLLAKRGGMLGVNSPLYKIPIYLESRLTAADAFEILDSLVRADDGAERELALECRRLAAGAEREAQVFRQLQRIYDTVAEAPDANAPEEVRRTCCDEFRKLYNFTDYRIEGWENLPAETGFVVVMNHLSNHPENTLPNEFQLTLDTHFVSAMILYERYGAAPVRVVRQSEPDEEGHRRYFDRLGYITVTAGSVSARGEQTRDELRRVRERFLEDARVVLAAGQNLVICPEGGSTKTESSPMPFRAGAFRVVRGAEPEPLMVPIAVANFDKQIARTRLAAKIFPPVRLSESVSPTAADAVLYEFINRFRDRYRGFVRQAAELAA